MTIIDILIYVNVDIDSPIKVNYRRFITIIILLAWIRVSPFFLDLIYFLSFYQLTVYKI